MSNERHGKSIHRRYWRPHICTRDVVDTAIFETVHVIEKKDQEQYDKYTTERITQRTMLVSDQMPLFAPPPSRAPSRAKNCSVINSICTRGKIVFLQ